MAPKPPKRTQRERLIDAMVTVANQHGHGGASITAIIAAAGVSRPTFYDYFADRDGCFMATIEDTQQQLQRTIQDELDGCDPAQALARAITATLQYADSYPARARFLTGGSMSGGRRALDTRDHGIAAIAAAIGTAQAGAGPRTLLPDADHRVLIGSAYRMIATRLRRGEAGISRLAGALLGWVASYEVPANARRWRELTPGPVPARSPYVPDAPIQQMPSVYPPGRTRAPEAEIAENHRLRILYATARMAEERGYTTTTVADIAKLARVDGHVFYRMFANKQEAFAAVHELGFQQVMDVTSRAFFSAEGWPQRSWEAGRALTQLLQANPLIAHVGFVEAYAVGSSAVQRIEDSHVAFMFFLQEGLMIRPRETPPSRVAMEAVIASVFEIIYLQARAPGEPNFAGMLGQIAHLWLTPFLGVKDSETFIKRRQPRGPRKTKPRARS